MKRLFTLIILFASFSCSAQNQGVAYWSWNFDTASPYYSNRFVIDTISNKHNLWHIGKPQQSFFKAAYSYPNALVTDTLDAFTKNDTSIFILKRDKIVVAAKPTYILSFEYMLHIDSGDKAYIEVSTDTGKTWSDLMKCKNCFYSKPIPRLDTTTSNWQHFEAIIGNVPRLPFNPWVIPDTVLFRFTFISDSINRDEDGWIIDNFSTGASWEVIAGLKNNNDLVNIFPNPSNGDFYIKQTTRYNKLPLVRIYDVSGKQVYEQQLKSEQLHLSLADGIYQLYYITDEAYARKTLVIKH